MKQILLLALITLTIVSCKTSKDYLQRSNEDRTLFDIVKKLNKSPNDADAVKALPIVFDNVTKLHVNKIEKYSSYKEITRWDKIIEEYTALQKIYEAIDNSSTASSIVKATSYQNDIYNTKQMAAEDYYNTATQLMQRNTREEIKKAYAYFNKANKLVPNYSDAKVKMQQAFEAATINVLINPVQDNSFFFNTGWGNSGYNYSNEYFQQNLVRELGGQYANRYPAKFYTEWEARRDNVKPDWVVDIVFRDLNIGGLKRTSRTNSRSASVESGRDTANRPIYQTVYGTITYNTASIDADAQMSFSITELNTRKNITSDIFRGNYRWADTDVIYSGDQRAFSEDDLNRMSVNKTYNPQPTREDILNQLYRQLYPRIKNKIIDVVDW